ncbi:MAG TPA: histidinol-phosphate transaminase [Chloroflexota bacterium]|nr:histidinol-phosphate transaminase [Chloroflexota bacterium]
MHPRPEVWQLAPAPHGGHPPAAERPVLDFSTNTNPLGPSPRVLAAVRAATVDRYPEPASATLRDALAARLGLAPERIVVGNGSVELLWLLALAYLERGDRVVVCGPTFAEYARAARLMGAQVTVVSAAAEAGFRPDLDALRRTVTALAPRVTFLCNPNNPTGVYLDRSAVEAVLAATPGLLVVDEAYVGFVEQPWDIGPLLADERLVVLRSLTKDHALPGLRLGYALAAPPVAAALHRVQPPWSVNALAQAAGLAALEDDAHVARGRALAARARVLLATGLEALRLPALPSATNFLLVEVGDAAATTAAWLSAGVYVRDCTSFGLPRHVRIAARPLAECRVLLRAARAWHARRSA